MRAIIDNTGLPWATGYYRQFPFEPAMEPANDITIDGGKIDAVNKLTLAKLISLLDTYTQQGETSFLIVCHANNNGMRMPVSASIPKLTADKTVLDGLVVLADLLELIDDMKSGNVAVNQYMRNAWVDMLQQIETFRNSLPNPSPTATPYNAPLTGGNIMADCAEALKRGEFFLAQMLKQFHVANVTLLRPLLTQLKRVQRVGMDRIELRACNIGDGPGLKSAKAFFGCGQLYAPKVRTFYVPYRTQLVPDQGNLETLAGRIAGPNTRVFRAGGKASGPIEMVTQVVHTGPGTYNGRNLAPDTTTVASWVKRFQCAQLGTFTGAGPWTMAGFFVDTNPTARSVFPLESQYRTLIVGTSNWKP
jgi:hypothetical protein